MSWTIQDVINRIHRSPMTNLQPPPYRPPLFLGGNKLALAVPSMRSHTTDEGWQLMLALRAGGYSLAGHGEEVDVPSTDVRGILKLGNPSVVVVQDQREWEGRTAGPGFDHKEEFKNVDYLKNRPDIFTLTVLKDAQNSPDYHARSADAMGCHAWIIYYHPRIVSYLAPYVRGKHLVRTHHTIDSTIVPPYEDRSGGCILSGAVSRAYPLRSRLINDLVRLYKTTYLPHPGYGRAGCHTPNYLKTLSQFRVAICTSSRFGYALRKIIEATAAGCIVLTDLPEDEVLPEIDENLIRVHPTCPTRVISAVIQDAIAWYDPIRQAMLAARARLYYDYRAEGARLNARIESLRESYP